MSFFILTAMKTSNLTASFYFTFGASGSKVVKALSYKSEGRGFETRLVECYLPIYLILPAALGLEVYSVSKRNEYQREK
jgi:hypothetical protein